MMTVKRTDDTPGEGILFMSRNRGELAGETLSNGVMPGKGLVAKSDGLVRGNVGFLA
jgi:hypothetical protein